MLSAAVIVSLAIAIGACGGIFRIADALYLQRLHVPHPGELVGFERYTQPVGVRSYEYQQIRSATGIPRLAAYRFEPLTLVAGDRASSVWADFVSGNYFGVVGVHPLLGRPITQADEDTRAPVAVVSYDYWKHQLGGRVDVLGTRLSAGGRTVEVVGVMPRGYTGLYFARQFSVAMPVSLSAGAGLGNLVLRLLSRVRSGERVGAAARINLLLQHCCMPDRRIEPPDARTAAPARLAGSVPGQPPAPAIVLDGTPGLGPPVSFTDAARGLTWNVDYRAQYGPMLLALAAGGILLLVIACANIATLLLVKGEHRGREFAVRAALGASRGRVARLLLVEGAVLATAGIVLGLFAGWATVSVVMGLVPPSEGGLIAGVGRWPDLPTVGVIALAAASSIGLAMVFPVRRAGKAELASSLTGAGRLLVGRLRAGRVFVVVQGALAVALVAAAMLCVATVHNLTRNDAGYGTDRILVARLAIEECYSPVQEVNARCYDQAHAAERRANLQAALHRVMALPGVTGATLGAVAPGLGDARATTGIGLPGTPPDQPPLSAEIDFVYPGFFAATGVGMAAGRDFGQADTLGADPVVIVSESFARHYFRGRSPLGALLTVGPGRSREREARIVGVARDASFVDIEARDLRHTGVEMVYQPFGQARSGFMNIATLIVRTSGNPRTVEPALLRASQAFPGLRTEHITTLEEVFAGFTTRERVAAGLATAYGAVALLLAAIGLYGLLAFNVERRTREIGVRVALGATPRHAFLLVLRQTMALVGMGALLGVPLALAGGHALRSLLFEIGPFDPWVLAGPPVVLAMVAVAATLAPAKRAAGLDPMVAFRSE